MPISAGKFDFEQHGTYDGGWVCSELLEPRTTIVFSQVQNTIEYRAGCIAARYTRFRGAAYMREAAWKTLQRSVRSLAKFLFIDRSGISCGPGEFFFFARSVSRGIPEKNGEFFSFQQVLYYLFFSDQVADRF